MIGMMKGTTVALLGLRAGLALTRSDGVGHVIRPSGAQTKSVRNRFPEELTKREFNQI